MKHLKSYESKSVDLSERKSARDVIIGGAISRARDILNSPEQNIDHPKYVITNINDKVYIMEILKTIPISSSTPYGVYSGQPGGRTNMKGEESIFVKRYELKKNKPFKLDEEPVAMTNFFEHSKDYIVYESDDLNDCLEKLPTIITANKYN